MIAALATLVAGVLQIFLGLFMMSRTVIIGLLLVLCINIPMFFYGRSIKKLELQSRELPCPDPLLRSRYESAIMTWKKKMFPAF